MRPSKRALAVAPSETLRLALEIGRLRAAGRDVVSLLEGEPDLPVAAAVTAATRRALSEGRSRYSPAAGLPELKALLARKLKARNAVAAGPERIVVLNGAKQAVYSALQALCDPGDEVLIPAPYWVSFPEAARLAGAKPVFVPPRGGRLDVEAVGRAVTRRTKVLILNTPNNPTGAVYPKESLVELAKMARRRGFYILSDEAYEDLVFDGARHVSPASLSRDAARRTVTIHTFSKSYSMTGYRVGYLTAAAEIAVAVSRIHGHMTGNVCTFAQHGALRALGLGQGYLDARRRVFQRRRDLAFALASTLFNCVKPRGGLFVFPDVRRFLGRRFKGSAELAAHLLKEGKVAVVPGAACGLEGHLRIAFSGCEETIREGFARMKATL